MIKKIIACLTICFIITGIISPVFSDASALPQPNWSDPGISEIINISDLTGWMLNGGTFDVSQYTDSESFMYDYYNARTKTRLVSPEEVSEDYYEVLPDFGIYNQLVSGESFARPLDTNRVIASSFRDHTGYGRRLSNEVNDALLSTGHLYDTKIPLLNEVEFANFVGYNHDALRLYSEFFNNDNPSPTPNPDPDYETLIGLANSPQNGYGFFWGDKPTTLLLNGNNSYNIVFRGLTYNDYSWYRYANGFNQFPSSVNNSDFTYCSTGILTLNINSNNDNYEGVISNINAWRCADLVKISDGTIAPDYIRGYAFTSSNTKASALSDSSTVIPSSLSYTGTLYEVLSYFTHRFRNINIYVDGILWAVAGNSTQSPNITPEFPDAVGGEDLPTTTWPVHRPLAPYFITAPGMLRAIQDAIDDDGKLDIDDLKPYLTDENGDPVPDPQFDPEPVPIPVPDPVNPDVVPGLPVLPAMPPEMPGFSGVSVLAEIINFTNQSLPTALIVTFWGIVFGIVILGLIKILHK